MLCGVRFNIKSRFNNKSVSDGLRRQVRVQKRTFGIIEKMHAIRKDSVSLIAVAEHEEGQRLDNYLIKSSKASRKAISTALSAPAKCG